MSSRLRRVQVLPLPWLVCPALAAETGLDLEDLEAGLQAAHNASRLPGVPSDDTTAALNALLVRLSLAQILVHLGDQYSTLNVGESSGRDLRLS